jgi:peroxiredoxin Q/BCP
MSTLASELLNQTFETTDGEQTLAELIGDGAVLFFYPRASTPGCTKEAEGFRNQLEAFSKAGYRVLGASRDKLRAQQRFAEKLELPYPLIADPEETLCEGFGVMAEKNMYGKTVRGIERSTFVLDKSGNIVQEWRKVKVPGHVDEVLASVQAGGA